MHNIIFVEWLEYECKKKKNNLITTINNKSNIKPRLYLQDLPFVKIKNFLFQAIIADRLHADQPEDLDKRVLLRDAVFYVSVNLHKKYKDTDY